MQSLFYHNHSKSMAFTRELETKSVVTAITLHPIKRPAYLYRLHSFFLRLKIRAAMGRSVELRSRLKKLNKLLRLTGALFCESYSRNANNLYPSSYQSLNSFANILLKLLSWNDQLQVITLFGFYCNFYLYTLRFTIFFK